MCGRKSLGQAWMLSFKFREMLDHIAGAIRAEVPAAHAAAAVISSGSVV